MDIVILVIAMLAVGILIAWLAGFIWDERPLGGSLNYVVGAVTALAVGLIDWFVIPAMGFSPTLQLIGVILEPPLAVLIVFWIIKRAKE